MKNKIENKKPSKVKNKIENKKPSKVDKEASPPPSKVCGPDEKSNSLTPDLNERSNPQQSRIE